MAVPDSVVVLNVPSSVQISDKQKEMKTIAGISCGCFEISHNFYNESC